MSTTLTYLHRVSPPNRYINAGLGFLAWLLFACVLGLVPNLLQAQCPANPPTVPASISRCYDGVTIPTYDIPVSGVTTPEVRFYESGNLLLPEPVFPYARVYNFDDIPVGTHNGLITNTTGAAPMDKPFAGPGVPAVEVNPELYVGPSSSINFVDFGGVNRKEFQGNPANAEVAKFVMPGIFAAGTERAYLRFDVKCTGTDGNLTMILGSDNVGTTHSGNNNSVNFNDDGKFVLTFPASAGNTGLQYYENITSFQPLPATTNIGNNQYYTIEIFTNTNNTETIRYFKDGVYHHLPPEQWDVWVGPQGNPTQKNTGLLQNDPSAGTIDLTDLTFLFQGLTDTEFLIDNIYYTDEMPFEIVDPEDANFPGNGTHAYTPSTAGDQSLAVTQFNPATNCESQPAWVNLVFDTNLPQPSFVATSSPRCSDGPNTFTVEIQGTGDEISIWDDPTAGTDITSNFTITALPNNQFRITSAPEPAVLATYTYHIEAFSSSDPNCVSPARVPMELSWDEPVQTPTISGPNVLSRCGPGQVTFENIQLTGTNTELRIYDQATGGSEITSDYTIVNTGGTNWSITTPFLTANKTFYVEAVHLSVIGGNPFSLCQNNTRLQLNANILTLPDQPYVDDAQRCGNGDVTFSVSTTQAGAYPPGTEFHLKDLSGAVHLGTFDPISLEITQNVGTTTSFLVVADYSAMIPGCVSFGYEVEAMVHPVPTPPTTAHLDYPPARCGVGPVDITVLGLPTYTDSYRFFDTPGGPFETYSIIPAFVGQEYQSPNLNTPGMTTSYAYSYNSQTGCLSNGYLQVDIEVLTEAPSQPMPESNELRHCGTDPMTFSAQMTSVPGNRMRLYSTAFGPNVAVDNIQPPYDVTLNPNFGRSIYYLTSYIEGTNCESWPRVPIIIDVNPHPLPPTLNTTSDYVCDTSETLEVDVNLPSSYSNLAIAFDPNGDVVGFSNSPPYTLELPIDLTGTYEIFSGNSVTGCRSETSVSLDVDIKERPLPPVVDYPPVCETGPITFTLSNDPASIPTNEAFLYPSANAKVPITAVTGTAPYQIESRVASSSQRFWFTVADNYCQSELTEVAVQVANRISPPQVPEVLTRCGVGPAEIPVTVNAGEATHIRLYDEPFAEPGDELVEISTTNTNVGNAGGPIILQSPDNVNGEEIFYVAAASGTCESPRLPVRVRTNPAPENLLVSDIQIPDAVCGKSRVRIEINPAAQAIVNGFGREVRLYTQSNAETPIAISSGPTYIFETPEIDETTVFWLEVFDGNALNCTSPNRLAITVPVNQIPPMPSVDRLERTVCANSESTLKIDLPSGPGSNATYKAFSTATGTTEVGNLTISTNNDNQLVLETGPITTRRSFWLEAQDQTTGCTSTVRLPVNLDITPLPGRPAFISNPGPICAGTRPTLTVSLGTASQNRIRVYEASAGNDPENYLVDLPGGSQTAVELPEQTTAGTRQLVVRQVSPEGCIGTGVNVDLEVVNAPTLPEFTQELNLCGKQRVSIPVNGITSNQSLRLYNSENAPEAVSNGAAGVNQIITPTEVEDTVRYWIALVDVRSGCESTERKQVTITSVERPTLPENIRLTNTSLCGRVKPEFELNFPAGVSNLEARLYAGATENQVLDSREAPGPVKLNPNMEITAPRSFWISFAYTNSVTACESDRREVNVPVSLELGDPRPLLTQVTLCERGPGKIRTRMGSPAGAMMRLWDAASGGNLLAVDETGPIYELEHDFQEVDRVYFLETFSPNDARDPNQGCTSDRIPVRVRITTDIATPALRSLDVTRCGPGEILFSASPGSSNGESLRIYASNDPQAPVLRESSATEDGNIVVRSSAISQPTDFWISRVNAQGCESARIQVTGRTQPRSNAPGVQTTNLRRCGGQRLTLSVAAPLNATNGSFILYDENRDNSEIARVPYSSNTLTIPGTINASRAFWVAFEDNGRCPSERVRVDINIDPVPGIPAATARTRCGSGIVEVSVRQGEPSAQDIRFYDAAEGGNSITAQPGSEEDIYVLPEIETDTEFWIEAVGVNGCTQPVRSSFRVEVDRLTLGGPLEVPEAVLCGVGTARFSVPWEGLDRNTELRLYESVNDDVPYSTANSTLPELPTPEVTQSTTFYVTAHDNTTGCETDKIPAVVRVRPGPVPPVVAEADGQVIVSCANAPLEVNLSVPGETAANLRIGITDRASGGNIVWDQQAPYRFDLGGNDEEKRFWFVAALGNTCFSERTLLTLKPVDLPSAPEVATTEIEVCGNQPVEIRAFPGQESGTQLRLYTQATGPAEEFLVESQVEQGAFSLELPAAEFSSSDYYLGITNASTWCHSDERTRVSVRRLTGGVPGFELENTVVRRCGPGRASLTLTEDMPAGTLFRFYENQEDNRWISTVQPEGRSIQTPWVNDRSTFHLAIYSDNPYCPPIRKEVQVRAVPQPAPPINVRADAVCGAVEISASMNNPAGTAFRVYRSETSPDEAFEGTFEAAATYPLQSDISAREYWIAAYDAESGCQGRRVPVPAANRTELPTQPQIVVSESVCRGSSLDIQIMQGSIPADEVILQLDNGVSLNYVAPRQSRLYTPQSSFKITGVVLKRRNAGSNTFCEVTQPLESPIVVEVLEAPITPDVPPAVNFCTPGVYPIEIGAIDGETVTLYDTPDLSNPIQSIRSAPYTFTLDLNTDRNYYVVSERNGCRSAIQTIAARRTPAIASPSVPSSVDVCRGEQAQVPASMGVPAGTGFRLYANAEDSDPIETFPASQTLLLIDPPTEDLSFVDYWISAVGQGCESSRRRVRLSFFDKPTAPTVTQGINCDNGIPEWVLTVSGTNSGEELELLDSEGNFVDVRVVTDDPASRTFRITGVQNGDILQIRRYNGLCASPAATVEVENTNCEAARTTTHGPVDPRTDVLSSARVYPNPAMHQATIGWVSTRPGQVMLQLQHLTGQTIWTQTHNSDTGSHEVVIPLEDVPAGVYMLQLIQGQQIRTLRLIRQ